MEGTSSNTVSNIRCSGSFSSNSKNSHEFGNCVFYHDDDETLATDVVDQISKVSKCMLYSEIKTRKNNFFGHLSDITQNCTYIILLITENMQKDEQTQHLRDELIRIAPKKIFIITNGEVNTNDFGIASYRKIDWRIPDKDKARKIQAYFKDTEHEIASQEPPKPIIYIANAIMQAGNNNVVNVYEATEKPRDMRELMNLNMNKIEPNEVEPNKVEQITAGLNKTELNKVKPSKAELNKIEPSKAELNKAEPNN
ncbi:uncharacterized protein LOC115213021 isoform X2 [Octopus sinensis]|uniref:Uncharacterized protein LOC115213021 isoform X2 n=1 Tax=Octopus sinensis TaxID=2607531 RepID=A0A7E6EWZ3_9MOLL|nr:uncharacterized protein LOC115213021 isoform X2 [Octopus sinensis]